MGLFVGGPQIDCFKKIKKQEPYCIIGSPPCTQFSVLMDMNKHLRKDDEEWQETNRRSVKEAIQHIDFCCVLYRHQLKRERHLIHEHPWSVKSWKLDSMK